MNRTRAQALADGSNGTGAVAAFTIRMGRRRAPHGHKTRPICMQVALNLKVQSCAAQA